MNIEIATVRFGLVLVFLTLAFGVGLGITFGVNEAAYKTSIATSVAANPDVHDEKSPGKIWRYAQRAHFHATGIAAFSLGLIILTMFSGMTTGVKSLTAILIGSGGLYPLAWFTMFLLAPSIGRGPAHDHILTEFFTYTGVGGLLAGMCLLVTGIFFNRFQES